MASDMIQIRTERCFIMRLIDRNTLTSNIFRIIVITLSLIPGAIIAGVHEQTLTENDFRLERWDIPLLRLVITDIKPNPNQDSYYIEVNLIEIIRTGNLDSSKKAFPGEWQPYRNPPLRTTASFEIDKDIVETLLGSELICFTGSNRGLMQLYAYRCFADTAENRAIAAKFSRTMPISSYVFRYTQIATLIFPLIALAIVLFFERIAIVFAALTFPAFLYYNEQIPGTTVRYDLILAYPAMILAAIIIVFALIRLLSKVVKDEQNEKAIRHRQDEIRSD